MNKTKSLKKEFDFKKTIKYGTYKSGKIMSTYVLEDKKAKEQDINYIGICVSKKHGNSVVRNRLKRWIREAYKGIEDTIVTGKLIVVIYRKNIKEKIDSGELNYFLVKEEFEKLMEKVITYERKN